jgi:hypothetical protein
MGCIISNGKSTKGGSLIPEKRGDGSGVDTRKTGDVMSLTPFVDGFDGLVVRVLERDVRDDDTGTLDTG